MYAEILYSIEKDMHYGHLFKGEPLLSKNVNDII